MKKEKNTISNLLVNHPKGSRVFGFELHQKYGKRIRELCLLVNEAFKSFIIEERRPL